MKYELKSAEEWHKFYLGTDTLHATVSKHGIELIQTNAMLHVLERVKDRAISLNECGCDKCYIIEQFINTELQSLITSIESKEGKV